MRFLRRLTVGFVVLLVVVAIVVVIGEAIFHSVGTDKLNQMRAQIDAEDPAWRLDDLEAARTKNKPADELNSALIVVELSGQSTVWWNKHRNSDDANFGLPSNRTPSLAQMIWMLQAKADTQAFREAARERLLRPEVLALSGGCYPIQHADNPFMTLLPHAQKARELAFLLDYDAKLATLEGVPDRGIRSARASLVVAKSLGEEPFLISQLVRMAVDNVSAQSAMQVLAWGQPKNGFAEFQAELRAEADFPWLAVGLRGERAVLDKVFANLESGKMTFRDFEPLGVGPGNKTLGDIRLKVYQGFLPGDHAKSLEIISAYLAASKLPHHEQVAALKAIPVPPGPPEDFRYILTRLVLPACSKVAEASLRTRAALLTASTAIACERHRLATQHWPNSLDEIPRSILPEVPTDPYTGQAIQLRKLDDGIAIFSVGDGNPRNVESRRQSKDPLADLGQGWRLWNPELRGIPGVAELHSFPFPPDVQNP